MEKQEKQIKVEIDATKYIIESEDRLREIMSDEGIEVDQDIHVEDGACLELVRIDGHDRDILMDAESVDLIDGDWAYVRFPDNLLNIY